MQRSRTMDKDEFSRQARDATQSLYRVACAYLASPPDRDDAVQEALLRAWEKRRTLREEQYFKTWLTRILIRVCVDMQRRKKRVIVSDNLPEQIAPRAARSPAARGHRAAGTHPSRGRGALLSGGLRYPRNGFPAACAPGHGQIPPVARQAAASKLS